VRFETAEFYKNVACWNGCRESWV